MTHNRLLYLCHGIVVGAVDRIEFYERVANGEKDGLILQKITIFGQGENTAYFDCRVLKTVAMKAIEDSARRRIQEDKETDSTHL